MPLTIYRRHADDCNVHQLKIGKRHFTTEEKRAYQDCGCAIWVYGTTEKNELYPRQSLKTRDWATAEARVRTIDAGAKDETVYGPTIEECIQKYLDSREDEIGTKALGQFRLVLGNLKTYAHGLGKHHMRDPGEDLITDFKTYELKKLAGSSKAAHVSKVKSFMTEAGFRGWIEKPVKIKSPKFEREQVEPFDEEQLPCILKEASNLNGGVTGFATNGEMFRLLLEVMLSTGMRVSDAVRFNPSACVKGERFWSYTFKAWKRRKGTTPKPITVFVTDELMTAINGGKWFSCAGYSAYPFAYRALAKKDETDYLSQAVYERMQDIGKRCSIEDCRPHRLRHTFAVRLLLKGMSLDNVSKLLGHSSVAITEKYYASWTTGRKLNLERLLSETI
jgi:integrase/recombinase XerD